MPKKIVLTICLIAGLAAVGGGVYYVRHRTPTTPASETTRPVNDVDYGPPKAEDSSGIQSSKDEAAQQNKEGNTTPTPPTGQKTLTISITQAAQANGQIAIRALVGGTTTGTCDLSLTKTGSATIAHNARIGFQANYAICQGFNIPLSEFGSGGEWTATITAKTGDVSVSAQQKVTVTKE